MDDSERAALIRRGNEFFNKGDIRNALKIFLSTNYGDGLIRVGDYYYFEKNDRVTGVRLYKKAGYQKGIEDFAVKAAQLIRLWMAEDRQAALEKAFEKTASPEEPIKAWAPTVIRLDDLRDIHVHPDHAQDKEK